MGGVFFPASSFPSCTWERPVRAASLLRPAKSPKPCGQRVVKGAHALRGCGSRCPSESLGKHSFPDKCVPKYNLGTRGIWLRDSSWRGDCRMVRSRGGSLGELKERREPKKI